MDEKYIEYAAIFKALTDVNRLMIVRMLSGGELCACKILEKFDITQPTLSHHMKVLRECGLVEARQAGKWKHYSLKRGAVAGLEDFLHDICSRRGEPETIQQRPGVG